MPLKISKTKYRWLICFACLVLMFCNMGLCSNIIAVFMPFIENTGLSGTQGSSLLTIRCALSFLCTFAINAYFRFLSLRKGMVIATAIGALACLAGAIGGNVYVYYLYAALCGIAYGFGTIVPITLLINNWFEDKRGLALGISVTGSGFATILFSPLITRLVLNYGLRFAFLFQAVFTILCSLAVFIIVRDTPTDEDSGTDTALSSGTEDTECFSIPRYVWILFALMLFITGGTGNATNNHIAMLSTTSGYSPMQAASFVSVFGVFLVLGKILIGKAIDVFGTKKASTVFILLYCTGCMMATGFNGKSTLFPYLLAFFMGSGSGLFTVAYPLWASDLVSAADYRKTLKYFQILYNAGGIMLSSIPGRIADITGEYNSSYILIAAIEIPALIILLLCYRLRKSRYESGGKT